MAASRKSLPNSDVSEAAAACLARHVPPHACLTLALSGGLDSAVLLHLLAARRASYPFSLKAVHVNHGLSPHAEKWEAFCQHRCDALEVGLSIHRVRIGHADPAGVEAAARRERRAVFAGLDTGFLLTAHHQNDQAETLLLQLLRGSGPKGLAAMPEAQRVPGWHAVQLRPLLACSRSALRQYAQAYGLSWVEDESNQDPRYRRNVLRQRVIPELDRHFPGAAGTLARAAALQAESAALMDDLAAIDSAQAIQDGRLDCAVLSGLSDSRARNLLRYFIAQQGWPLPNLRRLNEALHQLRDAQSAAGVCVGLGRVALRRYRRGAYLVPVRDPLPQTRRVWQGEAELVLEQLGKKVLLTPTRGAGLSRARLEAGHVELGVRAGRETLRLAVGGPHRTLKNLLQEAAVPPWERDRLPVLLCNGALVWAEGVGMDADHLAAPDEPGISPQTRVTERE
ncbi:MAG: tRNA lysidine(34) synthetase TilS [Thiobacillus sp.]|nr:tRNA lysidine(34) synthetase TilS [Thiobacillus sp.]